MTAYDPLAQVPATLLPALARVRCVILDIDGVLTDGKLYLSDSGEEHLAFHVRDGYGIKNLLNAGIVVGVISGRSSVAARQRLEALGVGTIYQGRDDKIPAFEEFLAKAGVSAADTLYMGDDTLDLPVLERVGVPVTVADGHPAVRERVAFVTQLPGGSGAVREMAEAVLAARAPATA